MVISTQHLMPTEQSEPLTTPQNSLSTSETVPGLWFNWYSKLHLTGFFIETTVQPKLETDAQAMDVDPPDVRPAENQIVDVEEEAKAPLLEQPPQAQPAPSTPSYPGGYAIDVCFEASKLPLDVAIFNSARAAGGDEKIRKYLQAVLVIGGSALIPGMAHALESRLTRFIILIPLKQ